VKVNQTSRSADKCTREEYAVMQGIRNATPEHETSDDPLLAEITPVVREAIEDARKSELARALGASLYARVGDRSGYRNGALTRDPGTPRGLVKVAVPKAPVHDIDGGERERRTEKLPRYSRRMRGIDKAVVRASTLSGTNQRRIQGALRPQLKGLPLPKSAVSRVAARLREECESWMGRDLGLVIIGVKDSGEMVLLSLRMASEESKSG
jgi:transposase-like protein